MSTPKPGQIRCPTCLRSTPPAAYCTQCGSPIPPSARARPRGLDRDELEEHVRRRPGDAPFRRGAPVDDESARAGYVPFQPEPEDALAIRREEEAARRVDRLPPPDRLPDAEEPRRVEPPPSEPERSWAPPPPVAPAYVPPDEPEPAAPEEGAGAYAYDEEPYRASDYDDEAYGRPEDAYAYPYPAADDRRGGGGGALPIIGFVVLCVLALAVGAVLAGLLGQDDTTGQATPSPSAAASEAATPQPSEPASAAASASAAPATPEPTDGPVAFPDGALLTIQPCATNGYRDDAVGNPEEPACEVDGSTVDDGRVWAIVVFRDTDGVDSLRVRLRSNGETINEQEFVLSSILNQCGADCDGLVHGAQYANLLPGTYELVLHRNGEFADSATFVVEG